MSIMPSVNEKVHAARMRKMRNRSVYQFYGKPASITLTKDEIDSLPYFCFEMYLGFKVELA